ncbi:MAG: class I SAM-dependent methyltransferase [Halobacteriales archaeon]
MAGDRWFFERVAPLYDLAMPDADPAILDAALDRAGRPVERVLDVGGGTGRAASALGDRERVVLDLSRQMLRRVPTGIGRVLADARSLPVRPGAADAVLVVDALHHLPDVPAVLAEAARVLRPGGVLVVREFDPTTLRGRALAAAEHAVGMDSAFLAPGTLVDRVRTAGLDPAVLDRGVGYTVAGTKPGP